jgi:hypothetical protein
MVESHQGTRDAYSELVIFDLEPPRGVGPLLIGMTRTEALEVLRTWGEPEPFQRTAQDSLGWLVRRVATTFVYCDSCGIVEAIEFGSPGRGVVAGDRVMYRGIDLFATRAREVLQSLCLLGVEMYESERGSAFTAPDILLALWRYGEPYGEDGLPEFFESVLMAQPGYLQ